jgi:hypothetical protein
MNDSKWWGVGASMGALAGLSLTLALGSGCEGEHRPYEPNFAGAAPTTTPAPAASSGAAGAGPDQEVSATHDVAS